MSLLFCHVKELPVKWIKELGEETSAIKGQPLYMTCELNKERDVIWKKNGEVLKKKQGKIQINIIGMQHAVTIQNSTEEDVGVFSCEVAGQEDVKTTTNVKVIGKQNETCCTLLHVSVHIFIKFCGLFVVCLNKHKYHNIIMHLYILLKKIAAKCPAAKCDLFPQLGH